MLGAVRMKEDNLSLRFEEIKKYYHIDENQHVEYLLSNINKELPNAKAIELKASNFVTELRKNRKKFGGLDSFLQDFGLTTAEGISLMCLAEALLRIPDADTADKLIKDKIGGADWDKHIGKGSDLFVNASTWALMLTGKVIGDNDDKKAKLSPSNIASNMVARLGEPIIRQAMYHAMKVTGRQFVMGRNINEALKRAIDNEKLGYRYSYDMLGEGARTAKDADKYFNSYRQAIQTIGKAIQKRKVVPNLLEAPGISIKLSALHPRYEYRQSEKCIPELTARLLELALMAKEYNISLTVDAEEANRLEISLQIIENVFSNPELGNWTGFGLALQAYSKRAPFVIDWLAELAKSNNRKMMVRLVKGAYWDSEIKHAQELGLASYPVFTRKASTDLSFIVCAKKLLENREFFYPQFATHNANTVAYILEMAGSQQDGFEFQRLHGMGEPLYHQLIGHENEKNKYPCRVYAPVGSHEDLLPYLVRRLLENGANSSFVNRIQDDKIPVSDIVADPIKYIANLDSKPHPKINLPQDMFDGRRLSAAGFEIEESFKINELLEQVKSFEGTKYIASAIISGKDIISNNIEKVLSPSNKSNQIGIIHSPSEQDVDNALAITSKAFKEWNATDIDIRAKALEKMADLLEENTAELMYICIHEAGKTIDDAIGEIREAVDFCRYYANHARTIGFNTPIPLPGPTGELNSLSLSGKGVFLCISPWNFPLAIFLGQITAALVSGNTVIAKPAEQTCLIASYAIKLLIKAGIPKDVVALLPLSGKMAGELIVPDLRINGVTFTGSTGTAKLINRTLANRDGEIVPLIAETGGQNVMIVDSSALPEQVIDDVLLCAFGSAGQRCSALRVLYLQDNIADKTIEMLQGAMQELTIGNPLNLSTDIGPVIDMTAYKMLQSHADIMEKKHKLIYRSKIDTNSKDGSFFAPVAFEIDTLTDLSEEKFGPILHVIRYKTEDLDHILDDINNSGYGLTLGVHTRINHNANYIINNTSIGNTYVNRGIIGAVVGVQPFGGHGLSGTGPKAGGPQYLYRFANEHAISIDITASGGNASLVSLSED